MPSMGLYAGHAVMADPHQSWRLESTEPFSLTTFEPGVLRKL